MKRKLFVQCRGCGYLFEFELPQYCNSKCYHLIQKNPCYCKDNEEVIIKKVAKSRDKEYYLG